VRRYASQFNDGLDIGLVVSVRQANDDSKPVIGGYAAKFDKMSQNLGGFKERIAPGFFNQSKGEGWPGVIARYQHEDNYLLGVTGNQTLRLDVDNIGLRYDVDINTEDASAMSTYARVKRGDVRQSSFAFIKDEDDWDSVDNFPRRTLITGRLVDVAPVNTPAYRDTSVAARSFAADPKSGYSIDEALRSLAAKFEADFAEVRKMADANELMRFFKRTGNGGPALPDPRVVEAERSAQAALMRVKNAPALTP